MDRPELFDYVVFFETEPEWTANNGWYYGARFNTTRGADRIVATVAPDDLVFSVAWWQGEVLKLSFTSTAVSGWLIETVQGREFLRVTFLDGERTQFCLLQLKPHVFIEWQMSW